MNADAKKRYKDIDFPFTCPITNREFNTSVGLSVYVTKTLKINHQDYYLKYINHRDHSCFFCGDMGKFISISKGFRNLCDKEECIKKSFSSHTVEGFMYRNMCSRQEAEVLYEQENKRQLEERLKSQEKLRKEDPLWDKKRSRNCKEFWLEKGYSEEDAILKSKEAMEDIHQKTSKKFKENPEKYASKYPTKIEYYIKRGFSEEESKEMLKDRQSTFSKEICIEKYGESVGLEVWKKRQEKWIKNLDSKTDEEKIEINKKKISGAQYSPISQILFWDLYNILGNDKTKFGELNKEFVLVNKDKKCFSYDYVDTYRKKCIEFNGDFWHCNPDIYKENYIHRVKGLKASDIWENDKSKIELIESKGYSVLTIWESEFKKNPQQILYKCIEFLNKK